MDVHELARIDRAMTELRRLSKSLHSLAEAGCNFGLTERQGKRRDRLEKNAEALAVTLGLKAYFQTDPRGCYIYLIPEEMTDEEADSQYSSYLAVY